MELRSSIKSLLYIFTVTLSLILSACVASATPSSVQISATATPPPTSTQAPIPTEDLATQKQKIWDEFLHTVAAYNTLVEQEKLSGNIQISHNSGTGQDTFTFTGTSDRKIRAAHDKLISQFQTLGDSYLALYKQAYNPTPFPVFNTKEETLKFYYQIMQEDNDWMDRQKNAENALKIYDPDRGTYESYLTFEQDAWLKLRNEALGKLRMDAELHLDLQTKHKTIVEKLDGGSVISVEIDSRPWYRNDVTLFQYHTQKNYYLLNADGAIIEITPVDQTTTTQLVLDSATAQVTSKSPLTQNQLEQQARAFINFIAPGINLDALKASFGGKTANYFFKWEDQAKPPLDGGGFPFVQVALNESGELLNYINTLPFAR